MSAMSSASSDIDRRPFALIALGVRGKIVTRMGETSGLRSLWRIELNAAGGLPARIFQRNFTKMNRSDPIDSYLSLDVKWRPSDDAAMLSQPYQLYVERTDKARNMARFYAMTIEPDLFGEVCLTRRWGRIGAHGQMKVQHFTKERDAVAAFLDLLRRKRSRGYRVKPRQPVMKVHELCQTLDDIHTPTIMKQEHMSSGRPACFLFPPE